MSLFSPEVSRKEGQMTGTGLARAIPNRDVCPVPVCVPISLFDVPNRRSLKQAVWRELDANFSIALFALNREWVKAWVAHRTRVHGTGSWRVAWSPSEARFANNAEFKNMAARAPHLPALVSARIVDVLRFRNGGAA